MTSTQLRRAGALAIRAIRAITAVTVIATLGACSSDGSRSAQASGTAAATETVAPSPAAVDGDWTTAATDPRSVTAADATVATALDDSVTDQATDTVAAAAAAPGTESAAPTQRPELRGRAGVPEQSPSPTVWDQPIAERPINTMPPVTTAPPITTPDVITGRDAGVNPTIDTRDDTRSTFAMDVDTGSYTLARTQVSAGQLPSYDTVRTEEFVNYFDQQYRSPAAGKTFAIHVDGTAAPFVSPAARIVRVGIQGRRIDAADRKPVRLTFVVDNSGSMEEDGKLEMVKGAMRTLLASLRPDDRIAIVGFSDNAWVVLGPTGAAERARIAEGIERMAPTNSTNAEAGLNLGYAQAQAMFDAHATNRVILLSDGVANVGPTGPEAILARIGEFARRDIDLNTVGVGTTSYNDEMMERLADAGDGTYSYVDDQQEAERLFRDRFVSTVETIARNAKVQVEFNPATVATYRLLGFENRSVADADFRNNKVDAGEIGAGHSVTALYEITLTDSARTDAQRNDGDTLATVRLRWEEPNGKVKETEGDMRNNALSSSFGNADPHLRLDVVAAAYAEVLRQGPWSRFMDLTTVATNAQRLVDGDGPFAGTQQVEELARLTQAAAQLKPGRTW